MLHSLFRRRLPWCGLLLVLVSSAPAQDSGALLDILVRKGILTDQEAEDVRAELTADSHRSVTESMSGGKSTTSLAISGRLQVQFAGLSSEADLPAINHLFVRRAYFGVVARIGGNWSANMIYDFAGASWDKAYVGWEGDLLNLPINLDIGLRKVDFGWDETTSSGSLKAIERSAATRYFVEGNNGRRLGAGSYHVGVFADTNRNARKGKTDGFYGGVAVTDPERPDNFDEASSAGNAAVNMLATWADVGVNHRFGETTRAQVGLSVGFLPDQGGKTIGTGSDLIVYGAYTDMDLGRLSLKAEFLGSHNEDGAAAGRDADAWGMWVMPSYAFTDMFEGVLRYSYVDSDGRGIKASDGVRSGPAALTGDTLAEYYAGLNCYFVNRDVVWQLGYVHGEATKGAATETVQGVRSQMQVNF